MNKDFEKAYNAVGDYHFWIISRRKIILSLLGHKDRRLKILDIGCSSGSLMADLIGVGFQNVAGVDISDESLDLARRKGLDVKKTDASKLDFKDDSFDIIIASDVLEHIENDGQALNEWHRVLSNDGIIIIFVPAFNFMWSQYDVINMHFRRYNKHQILPLLSKCRFDPVRLSYWNFFLFIPIMIFRVIHDFASVFLKMKKNSLLIKASLRLPNIMNKALLYILRLENYFILKGLCFPFGLSLFVLARKK